MNAITAGLKVDFISRLAQEPFVLQSGDDQGSVPIRVRPMVVGSWTRTQGVYDDFLDQALLMTAHGSRRVRLYCAEAVAPGVRFTVAGGSHRCLGRRWGTVTETLTWVRSQTRRLPFFYDAPQAKVVDHTRFFDNDGQEAALPDYHPGQGAYHHPQAVTGAMVVEYQPGFSLYEVQYDTGESRILPARFREMKLAWLAGNIGDVEVPPVLVIAMAQGQAAQLALPRDFWPHRAWARQGYSFAPQEPELIPDGAGYRLQETRATHACWVACKEKIRPDGNFLTAADVEAIRACVEQSQSPIYHYVETARSTRVERIFDPNDDSVYIDVERPTELKMRYQRADDGPCDQAPPVSCCPELTLRFKSDA